MWDSLRGLARGLMFGTYEAPGPMATPATVTPPESEPVQTAVVWLSASRAEPDGARFQHQEQRRMVSIRRDDVPAVPRGTLIASTPPLESDVTLWEVDGMDAVYPDHQRVVVIPATVET